MVKGKAGVSLRRDIISDIYVHGAGPEVVVAFWQRAPDPRGLANNDLFICEIAPHTFIWIKSEQRQIIKSIINHMYT